MSLGAAIDRALPFLQAEARSMQTLTLTVVRLGAFGDPDPATGVVTPTETAIYTGPGRVKPLKRVTAGSVTAGEQRSSESVYVVSLPHTATGVKAGDVVRITAAKDPELLTDTLRVINIEDSDQTTARRLTCELIEDRSA